MWVYPDDPGPDKTGYGQGSVGLVQTCCDGDCPRAIFLLNKRSITSPLDAVPSTARPKEYKASLIRTSTHHHESRTLTWALYEWCNGIREKNTSSIASSDILDLNQIQKSIDYISIIHTRHFDTFVPIDVTSVK